LASRLFDYDMDIDFGRLLSAKVPRLTVLRGAERHVAVDGVELPTDPGERINGGTIFSANGLQLVAQVNVRCRTDSIDGDAEHCHHREPLNLQHRHKPRGQGRQHAVAPAYNPRSSKAPTMTLSHFPKPNIPNNDVPEEFEPGAPPVEPDEGPVPDHIPDDPEHDRVIDPGAIRA